MLSETTLIEPIREDAERIIRGIQDNERGSAYVVTVTGLSGCGSEAMGTEIARMTGWRFIDDEIPQRMCQRLDRSKGELEMIETISRSWWRRVLWNYLVSYEQTAAYGDRYDGYFVRSPPDYYDQTPSLTKEPYLKGLKSVVSELAREGNVVLHGRGSHLFIPSNVPALHVFVTVSEELRQQRFAAEQELSMENAKQQLKRADRDSLAIHKNLFGSDLLDMQLYDLTLHLDRLSVESAARIVVRMLEATSLRKQDKVEIT